MQSQSLVIREAKPSDARTLMSLIQMLAELAGVQSLVGTNAEELRRAMSGNEPRFGAYLAEVDDLAVGFASFTVAYSIWYGECYISLEDVFVQDSMRGTDAGRQLILAIARLCEDQNCRARWELPSANKEARAFYESLGVTTSDKCVCDWSKAAIAQYLQGGPPQPD